jgi:hypothetical protein
LLEGFARVGHANLRTHNLLLEILRDQSRRGAVRRKAAR